MKRLTALLPAVLVLIVAALTGCQILPRTMAALSGIGSRPQAAPIGSPLGSGQLASDLGTLRLTVKWPQGPGTDLQGYHVQLLPNSTAQLSIAVSSGSTQVATASVSRQQGQATASATIELHAANNLSVSVTAYNSQSPAVAVATGSASGIQIVPSQDTNATVTMGSLYTPAISNLSTDVGQAGDTVTITGTNLSESWATTPAITFAGASGPVSATVSSASSTSVTLTVPSGAQVGSLGLSLDGVPMSSSATFWVPSSLSISASKFSWDPSPATTIDLAFQSASNDSVVFSSSTTWKGTTPSGSTPPSPTWSAAGSSLTGTLATASGTTDTFTADTNVPGSTDATTSVTASQGSLKSNAYTVANLGVTSVSISPATADVGAIGDIDATFSLVNTMADGSTNSAATYTASDPATLSVGASSGVASPSNSAYGSVTLTATSQLDSAMANTATVTVSSFLVKTVAGNGTKGFVNGAASSAEFNNPYGVTLDASGNVYVADANNDAVREISGTSVSTLTTDSSLIYGVDALSPGSVLLTEGLVGLVKNYNASLTQLSSSFTEPFGITASGGNYYVCDWSQNLVKVICNNSNGPCAGLSGSTAYTFVGSGSAAEADGTGTAASLNGPTAITTDGSGNFYVTDTGNGTASSVRKITSAGVVSTILSGGNMSSPQGIAINSSGQIFVTGGGGIQRLYPSSQTAIYVVGQSTNGALKDGIGTSAGLADPMGLAIDSSGDIYVADRLNYAIRELIPEQ